ncbi:MAG: TolC family protein, partial [Candidatus Hydrogenedentes bacterium]|nr:TolC family protein [Candidatus Hydrogenedentota bacterium]
LIELLDSKEHTVTHTEGYDATVQISEYLPTGTELTLTSGFSWGDSSVADDSEYAGNWSVGVSQALLRGFGPAVNLVALRQARNDSAISDLAFRDYVLSLVEQVESAYWELALAQETLEIRKFSLGLAQEQLKLNEALISVGSLSGSALISAEAEVAAQNVELVDAEGALDTRAIALWQLLNPESRKPAEMRFLASTPEEIGDEELAADRSVRLAMQFRPDLAQSRLDLANQELAVIESKNGLLPRLDAFASYGLTSRGAQTSSWAQHLDDTTYDQFEVGLSFSTALGNRAEKARYRRAKLQQDQAQMAIRNLEQSIESDVRTAVVSATSLRERIAASRKEVSSREKELAVETDQFRLGRSTNLDVLQVQQNLIQAKLEEATARVRYLQALAALFREEGTLLIRRGIVLEDDREHCL